MKDKLEVGMYVRTWMGKIWVIKSQQAISGHKKDIKNANYNIMKLIEVGDYVNGHRVACVMESLLGFEDGQDGDWYISKENIKTILTHEQFDRMVYRIEA